MKTDSFYDEDYVTVIGDLIDNEAVWSMDNYIQHANISCLEHSFYVSYVSYKICKKLSLDHTSAARGGLLHDFFLYDWHKTGLKKMHGFRHPGAALNNANTHFDLNDLEKEIIKKHMWPLAVIPPSHKEVFIVMFVDKYCTCMEIIKMGGKKLNELFQ